MHHGTFRNKISKLVRNGEVKKVYDSHISFYTLVGHDFTKPMTADRMGVQFQSIHNHPIYKLLQSLPFGKQSIHDIRLKFKVPNIWNICSINLDFKQNTRSKDIVIPSFLIENTIIKIHIHKTDSVTVIVGCSLDPIVLDTAGIIRFFSILAVAEDRLKNILDNHIPINFNKPGHGIPEHKRWVVTMWHFGRDSLIQYYGDRFCVTVEKAQNILIRLYSKEMKLGKRYIRDDRQEYPQKSIEDAIEEKLDGVNSSRTEQGQI